jgi:hypothetical protein
MKPTPGEVISYRDMCAAENSSLQRGMNYRLNLHHSVVLMSVRAGAPYRDRVEDQGRILVYEGHDVPRTLASNPKRIDQPLKTPSGLLTQNGQFWEAVARYKAGQSPAEIVKVYEKIKSGIWVFNGTFRLIDAWQETSDKREVFKFKLEVAPDAELGENVVSDLPHDRFIPSRVKFAVWKRDNGRCVKCGSTDNLHFDHLIPFSRGGSSLVEANIQLLCARHNLEKRDKLD